jgi:hypothetical protein
MAAIPTMKTKTNSRTVRVLMWNVTSQMADFLFNLSNVVLVIGALAVLLGTIGSFKMGAIRRHFDNEKLAPRYLTPSQIDELSEKLKSFAGMKADIVAYPYGHVDIIPLSGQLNILLQKANWNTKWFKAMGGGSCIGIAVQTKAGSDDNIELAANFVVEQLNSIGITTGRVEAFTDNEIPDGGIFGDLWDKNAVAPIRINIGTKP